MSLGTEQVAAICRIAHDSSSRGAGRSLKGLLDATEYRQLRPLLTVATVAHYLAAHLEVLEQWRFYCGDKRTTGGWRIWGHGDSWTVDRLGPRMKGVDGRTYKSEVDACANFIVQELDFWATVG